MQLEGYSPTYTELLKIFYLVSKKHVFLSKKIKQALFSYKTATIADTKPLIRSLTSTDVSIHLVRCKHSLRSI